MTTQIGLMAYIAVFIFIFCGQFYGRPRRRRFTFRTVRHFGFAGENISRPDAECIIDKIENITFRKELHGAEKLVKKCRDELHNAVVELGKFERQCDAKTSSRLSRAQRNFVLATRRLLNILLSLGTIDTDELRRRMLKCDEYLRRFC